MKVKPKLYDEKWLDAIASADRNDLALVEQINYLAERYFYEMQSQARKVRTGKSPSEFKLFWYHNVDGSVSQEAVIDFEKQTVKLSGWLVKIDLECKSGEVFGTISNDERGFSLYRIPQEKVYDVRGRAKGDHKIYSRETLITAGYFLKGNLDNIKNFKPERAKKKEIVRGL